MHESEIDYTVYDANDDEMVITVRYAYAAGCKARTYGHPDDWHDSEGPEIDLLGATVRGREMSRDEFDSVVKRYGDHIYEKIAENEEDSRHAGNDGD